MMPSPLSFQKLISHPVLSFRQFIKSDIKTPSVEHLLRLLNSYQPSVFFIQIGANEGKTEDPIYPYVHLNDWEGIFVEPQPEEFKKLKKNYSKGKGLTFENVAIANQKGERTLYHIDNSQKQFPDWVSKLSSFDRAITAEVQEVYPKAQVAEMKVPCTTFGALVQKHQIKSVDLLYVDTEGYDFEILKTINFNIIKPEIIVFEHRHLSDEDFSNCAQLVENQGYRVFKDTHDGVAIRHQKLLEVYSQYLEKASIK